MVSRRNVLAAISRFGVAAMLPGVLPGCSREPNDAPAAGERTRDLIRTENARRGTTAWRLANPRIDPTARFRCPWVEGFFSHASARAGDTITLHVSTRPAARVAARLYRMGYYDGAGGRLVADLGTFASTPQDEPSLGPNRVRVCRWGTTTTIHIPADWPSGVYVATLLREPDSVGSYALFALRDDRAADLMVQCSDTTWQAYNRWPDQFSLYDNGVSQWYWGTGVDVSFDRPYGKYCQLVDQPLSTGSGEWFLWEFPLAFWLESQGYDVTYVSTLDTHADPAGLRRVKGFLSVGHDEYYTLAMFQNLRQAIHDGLHVAFLSGNTCCGLIELLDGPDGRPARIMRRLDRFGPRDAVGDQTYPDMKTLPRTAPNENTLVGARSTGPIAGGADWRCALPDHWLFAGTGMRKGDAIPGLVGWEWQGDPAPIPGLEIVATGRTQSPWGDGTYTATVYPGPRGNIVFNAATCWWADGLAAPPGYLHPAAHGAAPRGPDPRVQRTTTNLLARMTGAG